MNILTFVLDHWHDILTCIVLIAATITGIKQWTKTNGPIFKTMTASEKIAYVKRLLSNLVPIAMVLVTDAEIQYGGNTGILKRSYVIDELYQRIPDEYKKYITEENLDSIIDAVLPKAEKLWVDNPEIKRIMEGVW